MYMRECLYCYETMTREPITKGGEETGDYVHTCDNDDCAFYRASGAQYQEYETNSDRLSDRDYEEVDK